MFSSVKVAIDTICKLSKQRELQRQAGMAEHVPADADLRAYVKTLDYEMVKIIQIIMYIGRDGSILTNPVEIYIIARREFELNGWNRRDIEENQMLNKLPLHDYLENGCKILGI